MNMQPNPLMYTQEVGAAKVAHAVETKADSDRDSAHQSARGVLRQSGEQVQRPDATSLSAEVGEDSGGSGGGTYRRRREEKAADEKKDEEPSAPSNPLVGNLLNLKI